MEAIKARIFEIKRFAVHDGNGIRTTVFFKGCPLRCVWCHNPEGLERPTQLAYRAHQCVSCGACVAVCPANAHRMEEGVHRFDRSKCTACGACAEVCGGGALTVYGRDTTVEELLPTLLEDRDFYESSEGGVTLSGGECLVQSEFCAELLRRLKEEGIHTAVDTCGLVPREAFDRVMPYTDIFLYDLKASDSDTHTRCTGVSNRLILENLHYLSECGKPVEIRIPYVPDYNSHTLEEMASILAPMKNVTAIRVLPYHNYAGSKYESVGLTHELPPRVPTEEEMKRARATVRRITGIHVPE